MHAPAWGGAIMLVLTTCRLSSILVRMTHNVFRIAHSENIHILWRCNEINRWGARIPQPSVVLWIRCSSIRYPKCILDARSGIDSDIMQTQFWHPQSLNRFPPINVAAKQCWQPDFCRATATLLINNQKDETFKLRKQKGGTYRVALSRTQRNL